MDARQAPGAGLRQGRLGCWCLTSRCIAKLGQVTRRVRGMDVGLASSLCARRRTEQPAACAKQWEVSKLTGLPCSQVASKSRCKQMFIRTCSSLRRLIARSLTILALSGKLFIAFMRSFATSKFRSQSDSATQCAVRCAVASRPCAQSQETSCLLRHSGSSQQAAALM